MRQSVEAAKSRVDIRLHCQAHKYIFIKLTIFQVEYKGPTEEQNFDFGDTKILSHLISSHKWSSMTHLTHSQST